MAFTLTKLNPIGGQSKRGSAPQVWAYDNLAGDTVTGTDFFGDVWDKLTVGDILDVVNYTTAVPSTVVRYMVTVVAASSVTILINP